MEINEIIKKFNLLKKANNENYVTISELAKELKIYKTELMEFIEKNEELFSTNYIKNNRKNLGLCIFDIYEYKYLNPNTVEFALYNKQQYANTIYVTPIVDYGYIKGYEIIEDIKENSKHREHIWRNTKEKINELKKLGIISNKEFIFGSMFDSYNKNIENVLCDNWEDKLKEIKWKFVKC